jgi:uncharacterized protein YdiU (UPF0061 family)
MDGFWAAVSTDKKVLLPQFLPCIKSSIRLPLPPIFFSYGFLNQPIAGLSNYNILVISVAPVIAAKTGKDMEAIVDMWMKRAKVVFQRAATETFRVKLGLRSDQENADNLWKELEPLLRGSRVDWTLFWRQLTYVVRDFSDLGSQDFEGMMKLLEGSAAASGSGELPNWSPFYEPMSDALRKMWLEWIEQWRALLVSTAVKENTGRDATNYYERMRLANPKYVLREWMLVDAYKAAAKGNYSIMSDLHELIKEPYAEGSAEESKKYYRRPPEKVQFAGGSAFMS